MGRENDKNGESETQDPDVGNSAVCKPGRHFVLFFHAFSRKAGSPLTRLRVVCPSCSLDSAWTVSLCVCVRHGNPALLCVPFVGCSSPPSLRSSRPSIWGSFHSDSVLPTLDRARTRRTQNSGIVEQLSPSLGHCVALPPIKPPTSPSYPPSPFPFPLLSFLFPPLHHHLCSSTTIVKTFFVFHSSTPSSPTLFLDTVVHYHSNNVCRRQARRQEGRHQEGRYLQRLLRGKLLSEVDESCLSCQARLTTEAVHLRSVVCPALPVAVDGPSHLEWMGDRRARLGWRMHREK